MRRSVSRRGELRAPVCAKQHATFQRRTQKTPELQFSTHYITYVSPDQYSLKAKTTGQAIICLSIVFLYRTKIPPRAHSSMYGNVRLQFLLVSPKRAVQRPHIKTFRHGASSTTPAAKLLLCRGASRTFSPIAWPSANARAEVEKLIKRRRTMAAAPLNAFTNLPFAVSSTLGVHYKLYTKL